VTARTPAHRDLAGELVMLGTGTSVGVPVIGCACAVCQGDEPRNRRTRCGVVLGLAQGNLLIDTPPELRLQLTREQIGIVHAVAYTHEHADHVFGLDDLRLMQFYLGGPVPLYCEPQVEARIRKSFDYAFRSVAGLHTGATPQLEFRGLQRGVPLEILGNRITPIPLGHGRHFTVLGFRVGNVAYCTDVKEIPAASAELLGDLDVLILGCLRRTPHPTHMSLDEAVEAATRLGAKRTLLTHLSHDLDYAEVTAELPPGIELGYDGLRLPLT
jgi:phosphoribosyl 1,2-cyclic phosphate phosphodiesterase